MKKGLAALSLLLLLSLTSCGGESASEAGDRWINYLYINDAPRQYLASETYQEKDGRAIVLSVTCNLDRSGATPAVIFVATMLEKRDGWQIKRGPDAYDPNQKLSMILETTGPSASVRKISQDLLSKIPRACQKKYLSHKR